MNNTPSAGEGCAGLAEMPLARRITDLVHCEPLSRSADLTIQI
jgi:hypothetical protein